MVRDQWPVERKQWAVESMAKTESIDGSSGQRTTGHCPLPAVLGVTGASGAIYARRTLDALLEAGREVHLTMSPAAFQVFEAELGVSISRDPSDWAEALEIPNAHRRQLRTWKHDDLSAGIASGSFATSAMAIVPCSMSSLAAIAHGQGTNLVHRAADVHLKERRKLVLVPRETPLSSIAIENMARVTQAGAVVLPAMPGFYHNPKSINDLVDFVVARICGQLGVPFDRMRAWGAESNSSA